jgi:hypothetical protein
MISIARVSVHNRPPRRRVRVLNRKHRKCHDAEDRVGGHGDPVSRGERQGPQYTGRFDRNVKAVSRVVLKSRPRRNSRQCLHRRRDHRIFDRLQGVREHGRLQDTRLPAKHPARRFGVRVVPRLRARDQAAGVHTLEEWPRDDDAVSVNRGCTSGARPWSHSDRQQAVANN